MSWTELHHTLTALVTAINPPEESGLWVDRAELTIPLEARAGHESGDLVMYGRVPHSRWRSGFITPTNPSRLVVVATVERSEAA